MTHFPFPLSIDARGRTAEADVNTHVLQLIEQILFTNPGERVNRPDFGSGVLQLVFSPLSEELSAAAKFRVQSALQRWGGDAVTFEAVKVDVADSTLNITVQYVIRQSQIRQVATFSREV